MSLVYYNLTIIGYMYYIYSNVRWPLKFFSFHEKYIYNNIIIALIWLYSEI